jgi:hypothetical protein
LAEQETLNLKVVGSIPTRPIGELLKRARYAGVLVVDEGRWSPDAGFRVNAQVNGARAVRYCESHPLEPLVEGPAWTGFGIQESTGSYPLRVEGATLS